MQPNANAESDRTTEVTPEIKHTVPWRVKSVAVISDARLKVTFIDGTTGEVDMKSFLSHSVVENTVFEALRDPAVFCQAEVILGAVQWPTGAELAPDAMYDAVRERGVWVVE